MDELALFVDWKIERGVFDLGVLRVRLPTGKLCLGNQKVFEIVLYFT